MACAHFTGQAPVLQKARFLAFSCRLCLPYRLLTLPFPRDVAPPQPQSTSGAATSAAVPSADSYGDGVDEKMDVDGGNNDNTRVSEDRSRGGIPIS